MPPRSEDGWRSVPELSNGFQSGNCSLTSPVAGCVRPPARPKSVTHGFSTIFRTCLTLVPVASKSSWRLPQGVGYPDMLAAALRRDTCKPNKPGEHLGVRRQGPGKAAQEHPIPVGGCPRGTTKAWPRQIAPREGSPIGAPTSPKTTRWDDESVVERSRTLD